MTKAGPSGHYGSMALGALYLGKGRTAFRLWAPRVSEVDVRLTTGGTIAMTAAANGYFEAEAQGVHPGARYFYRLDGGNQRPDPASRYQPEGVHGPSEVTDPEFAWQTGNWRGLRPDQYIFYELHTGTFTPEGTLDAAIGRLDYLVELGITAVELMPRGAVPRGAQLGL